MEELKAGKPLFGKDRAFAPLLESILNVVLGGMYAYLTEESRQMGYRRNDKMQKQVRFPWAKLSYPPLVAPLLPLSLSRNKTVLAEGMSEKIIGLYALGTSMREIGDWMEEHLGNHVFPETISSITACVLPEIKA